MAEAYRTGKGVDEDLDQALYWYHAAAKQGSFPSALPTFLQSGATLHARTPIRQPRRHRSHRRAGPCRSQVR
ncbi:hypothetical protein GNZ13_41920 [Paraburkholderia sp. 5N]|uniref:Sel1 repeat family protein n=1 Tax=Paraburkholderia elongata TaxID=2675747 RepID=A0A972P034_9BURK|nr:hypothetical protein [Paraburkholderia elongata]NPT60932.1 hypothetical protein [Paraburkholderia elongata]